MEEREKYLKPTPIIDCGHKTLQEKANEVTKGKKGIIEKASHLFYFVRDEIKYDPYLLRYRSEHFRASNTSGGIVKQQHAPRTCVYRTLHE